MLGVSYTMALSNYRGWIYSPSKHYYLNMTLVAAIIADDGITVIGDGRVKNVISEVETDKQIKLFELSSQCVMLPSGHFFDGAEMGVELMRTSLRDRNITSVNTITSLVVRSFKENMGYDTEDPYALLFAGYDKTADGTYLPYIYTAESTDWVIKLAPKPYLADGHPRTAYQVFDDQYQSIDKKLRNINRLALRAMNNTMQADNDIGGDIALWNIKPGNRVIKKFDKNGVDILLQDIKNG